MERFDLSKRQEKKAEPKNQAYKYVQVGGGTCEVTLAQRPTGREAEEEWKELLKKEQEWDLYKTALLLRLKASGKELDPKWFNEAEAKAFQDSDASEWEAWIRNGVVRRLSPEESKKVPKSAAFRLRLRVVRVNKSKDSEKLQAKWRVVIPGHPGLGEYRSDSPTTTPTAIRMMKSISVTLNWIHYAFDVATAFLSGKNTDRLVHVKAPKEGLPSTSVSSAIAPFELLRVVKWAYGLSEAPRLWYLRAVELQKVGMIEIPFCRSTFIAVDQGACYAFCGLHVDDGFLCGDPKNPKFEQLRKAIDGEFNTK